MWDLLDYYELAGGVAVSESQVAAVRVLGGMSPPVERPRLYSEYQMLEMFDAGVRHGRYGRNWDLVNILLTYIVLFALGCCVGYAVGQ